MAQGSPWDICRVAQFPTSLLTRRPARSPLVLSDAMEKAVWQRSSELAKLVILSRQHGSVRSE